MKSIKLEPRASCALCKSTKSIAHIPFAEIPVVRCAECGFIYSSRVMSGEALDTYYANEFGGLRHLQGQIVNARVNSLILNRILKMEPSWKALDIGTGYGFLLKELRVRHGIESVGIELSKQEAEYGNKVLGLNILTQYLSDSGLPPESFDLVVACEVIEHTLDPIRFLEEMKPFVRRDGRIIIITDNFESRVVRSLGAGWPKWIPHTHVSHFAPASLCRAIEMAGYRVEIKASFTPWEHAARDLKCKLLGHVTTPGEGFDLEQALGTEMTRGYAAFGLRKILNPIWTNLTLRKDLEGAMMCVVASPDSSKS
jgi:SAM-dependent methyltransferase